MGANFEAGMKVRKEVVGAERVDAVMKDLDEITKPIHTLITEYCWGEIWTRPGLDVRSRRILVIGTMIAIGRWEEFQMHAAAAMREGGFTPGDLKEIVLQQAIYCGVPAAHHALTIVAELEAAAR